MKRILSVLLVALLVVTCLSTVAFAATVVDTGYQETFTVKVYGDEFSTYMATVSADPGVEIVSVNSDYVNGTTVGFMNGGVNVTEHTFSVTVKVTATNLGTYNVYVSVYNGAKTVVQEDGSKKLVPVTLSANGASFEIVCDHEWGEWEIIQEPTCKPGSKVRYCTKCGAEDPVLLPATGEHVWGEGVMTKDNICQDGEMVFTCSMCGETKTEVIPAEHEWETTWTHNAHKHWHECSLCGLIKDEADHILLPTGEEGPSEQHPMGGTWFSCFCGYNEFRENGPNPQVGDIRPMIFLGISAVLGVMASAAYVFKRKNNI